jgi:hypothetical protein
MGLGDILEHVADQPVDAKRIRGLVIPLTGQVAADASIDAGTGFTVAAGATGVYTITFDSAFAAAPTVIATVFDNTGSRVAHITSVSAADVVIQVREGGGTARDKAFHFVVFGPSQ